MEKLDLTKKYKSYYTAKATPELITIEKAGYVSITGKGDPSGKDFSDRVQALYATAYAIKFNYKANKKDFTVAKLEGLWWYDEQKYGVLYIDEAPFDVPRAEWEYRLLIRLPEFVTTSDVEAAKTTVFEKKQLLLAKQVTWFEMNGGQAVQMLHVGPFDAEPVTLRQMQSFMQANHLQRHGVHHEIYLSDFNKTEPKKLRTILREQVVSRK